MRVTGTLLVEDGEALIDATDVQVLIPAGVPPSPCALSNGALGGTGFGVQPAVGPGVGLNNVGLWIRAWGKIVGGDRTTFIMIDDGSGRTTDGLPGVMCYLPVGQTVPPEAEYAIATGVSAAKCSTTLPVHIQSVIRCTVSAPVIHF